MTVKIISEETVRCVRVAYPHTSNGTIELCEFLNEKYGKGNWHHGPAEYVAFGAPAECNVYIKGGSDAGNIEAGN